MMGFFFKGEGLKLKILKLNQVSHQNRPPPLMQGRPS